MNAESSAAANAKYAWRDLVLKGLPKRSPQERVSDFLEIYGLYTEAMAREQASRCIQCPNPSCVSGCPLCNPIPEWMRLTAEGRFLEAAAVLGSASSMADICARLCPQERLCEETCILSAISEPVSIRAVEQFLMEYSAAHGHADTATAPPNGLKVAVVGSGPAGLACADELAKRGYSITIFDSSLVPGGLLVHGIPTFKVEQSIVERRIEILKARGVKFKLGVTLGTDMSLGDLRHDFDAVFLGVDSRQARPLALPGGDAHGVIQALPFIMQKNTPLSLELPPLELEGKRIVVIGAGDTAIDCVRTALRCSPREVTCVYRRSEAEMPCARSEFQNAVEEGANFIFQALPIVVVPGKNGWVKTLRVMKTTPGELGSNRRRSFWPKPGTEFELEVDWVIVALGFDPTPCPRSGDFSDMAVSESGALIVDESQMTSIPGVFAGGDIVRGPSLVLHTVRDARKAATGIDGWLTAHKSAHA